MEDMGMTPEMAKEIARKMSGASLGYVDDQFKPIFRELSTMQGNIETIVAVLKDIRAILNENSPFSD